MTPARFHRRSRAETKPPGTFPLEIPCRPATRWRRRKGGSRPSRTASRLALSKGRPGQRHDRRAGNPGCGKPLCEPSADPQARSGADARLKILEAKVAPRPRATASPDALQSDCPVPGLGGLMQGRPLWDFCASKPTDCSRLATSSRGAAQWLPRKTGLPPTDSLSCAPSFRRERVRRRWRSCAGETWRAALRARAAGHLRCRGGLAHIPAPFEEKSTRGALRNLRVLQFAQPERQ